MFLQFPELLKKHKTLNLLLVFAYGIALILFHDFFVQLSVDIMNSISLVVYNRVVLVVSIFGGLILVAFLVYKLFFPQVPVPKKITQWKLFFLLITSLLIALHYRYMFEMNIEVVHVIEFALLSVLLFPLTGHFGASVVLTLPFILVNEAWQYMVLYPTYIHYFEFNDIVIDLLGCGMAMIFLWIAGIKPIASLPFWKSPWLLLLLTFDVLFVVLTLTCFLSFYPGNACSNTVLVLNQLPNPNLFWQTHVFGAVYHVMKPVEGMLAINSICVFFIFTDYVAANN